MEVEILGTLIAKIFQVWCPVTVPIKPIILYIFIFQCLVLETQTPQPVKRSMGRKRKAPADVEAEAEEHQKRREVQYQSLLAPMTQPPMVAENSATGLHENSFPQFPLPTLSDPQTTPCLQTSTHPEVVNSFGDSARPLSEMENMGYDQVITLSLSISYVYSN